MRHLRYFVAVAEEHSFSRAADRLWVAQPSLSTQIQRLEAELGSRLFDRHARGVDLTDAGRDVLEWARNVLRAADYALAMGREQADGLVGRISVGAVPDLRCAAFRRLLQMYGKERPLVDVSVVIGSAETLWSRLCDERLDAMVGPSMFDNPEVASLPLTRETWAAVLAADHRLARSPTITLDQLAGVRVLVRGDAHRAAVAELFGERIASVEFCRAPAGLETVAAVGDGRSIALTTNPTRLLPGSVVRAISPRRGLAFSVYWRSSGRTPALNGLLDIALRERQQMRWASSHDAYRRPAAAATGGR